MGPWKYIRWCGDGWLSTPCPGVDGKQMGSGVAFKLAWFCSNKQVSRVVVLGVRGCLKSHRGSGAGGGGQLGQRCRGAGLALEGPCGGFLEALTGVLEAQCAQGKQDSPRSFRQSMLPAGWGACTLMTCPGTGAVGLMSGLEARSAGYKERKTG